MISVVTYSLTFILSLCFVVFFIARRKISSFRSNVFVALIINIVSTTFVALISDYIEQYYVAKGAFFVVQYTAQWFYFFLHAMLAPLYCLYLMAINRSTLTLTKLKGIILLIPFVLTEILVIVTPFTNAIFKYDELSNFIRGDLEIVFYVVAALYMALGVSEIIRCSEILSKKHIFTLWYFFVFILAGVIVQALVPLFKVELFCENIALLGMMFSIESEEGLLDPTTRAYNRRGFVAENKRLLEIERDYAVITISILNLKLFRRLYGYQILSEIMNEVVDFVHGVAKRNPVYRTTSNNIAIICNNYTEDSLKSIVDTIEKKFTEKFTYYDAKIDFNVNISVIKVPQDFSDSEMILHIAENYISQETVGVKVFDSEYFAPIIRESAIEQALKEAITKKRFMVYFQPIWGVEKQKYVSAEALVRLVDPKLGFIPPDEFIPVAEKCALISDIGFIVYEKVCQAMATEEFKKLGLDYVEVNLSLHQMVTENFVSRILDIMEKYKITSDMINLEITESASYGLLQQRLDVMDDLTKCGFKCSLDDYGTGYSNLSFVANMDFVNIKSDKALLWDAFKNEKSMIILTETLQMIRKLKRNVIQEGVETKEQLDCVIAAGANYIQGYYFSRPLPVDEFIEATAKMNGVT